MRSKEVEEKIQEIYFSFLFCKHSIFFFPDTSALPSQLLHLACSVYFMTLKDLPAMVRLWWNSCEKRVFNIVDKFTSKYVSNLLSSQEIYSVQTSTQLFNGMMVGIVFLLYVNYCTPILLCSQCVTNVYCTLILLYSMPGMTLSIINYFSGQTMNTKIIS